MVSTLRRLVVILAVPLIFIPIVATPAWACLSVGASPSSAEAGQTVTFSGSCAASGYEWTASLEGQVVGSGTGAVSGSFAMPDFGTTQTVTLALTAYEQPAGEGEEPTQKTVYTSITFVAPAPPPPPDSGTGSGSGSGSGEGQSGNEQGKGISGGGPGVGSSTGGSDGGAGAGGPAAPRGKAAARGEARDRAGHRVERAIKAGTSRKEAPTAAPAAGSQGSGDPGRGELPPVVAAKAEPTARSILVRTALAILLAVSALTGLALAGLWLRRRRAEAAPTDESVEREEATPIEAMPEPAVAGWNPSAALEALVEAPTNGHASPAPEVVEAPTNGHGSPTPAVEAPTNGHASPTPAVEAPTNGHASPAPEVVEAPTNGHASPAPEVVEAPTNGHGTPSPVVEAPTNGHASAAPVVDFEFDAIERLADRIRAELTELFDGLPLPAVDHNSPVEEEFRRIMAEGFAVEAALQEIIAEERIKQAWGGGPGAAIDAPRARNGP